MRNVCYLHSGRVICEMVSRRDVRLNPDSKKTTAVIGLCNDNITLGVFIPGMPFMTFSEFVKRYPNAKWSRDRRAK